MNIIPLIKSWENELREWRHYLHENAELGLTERVTSGFIREKLESWGIKTITGLAGTGVMGIIENNKGPVMALRADMDALPLQELNDFSYKSRNPGVMHACGHDGHMTMLLGAARYLSENPKFKGTVKLIFQPAEEIFCGAPDMIKAGILKNPDVEMIFGFHNLPIMPFGKMVLSEGPIMASADSYDLTITGKGTHAAFPESGNSPIIMAADYIKKLRDMEEQYLSDNVSISTSVTTVKTEQSYNVIPEAVNLRGTIRTFDAGVRGSIMKKIEGVLEDTVIKKNGRYDLKYLGTNIPVLVNHAEAVSIARKAGTKVFPESDIVPMDEPTRGSEDFAFMLRATKGCFIFLGTGKTKDDPSLHNPYFDFNDDILCAGASLHVALVEEFLKP
jgi:hippurate hydrolase